MQPRMAYQHNKLVTLLLNPSSESSDRQAISTLRKGPKHTVKFGTAELSAMYALLSLS